ncbi:F-box/FBD/LRR-repeat protein At1g13570-like [Eucalyptus grandis]|uniref:F-box/FBD/LRR-repeat protein At1g13570-like n=1 Tax=Eucalyptus grandis TaxID=71139 RepID=UPI00192E858A|nr:F-box/FBD/LRR-repeat protein At1g13570-like [Eucalyptus grandis]
MERLCDFDEECRNSRRNKAKGVAKSEQKMDRIKALPDSILIHIPSLLPARDAVRTLIIPSFGRLWTSIYNLDFDQCRYHDCSNNLSYGHKERSLLRFSELVRCVLALHQGPRIRKFRLHFEFSMSCQLDELMYLEPEERDSMTKTGVYAGEVNHWIEFALNRNAEILDLDLRHKKHGCVCTRFLKGTTGIYEITLLDVLRTASELSECDVRKDHAVQLVQFLLRKILVLQKLVIPAGSNNHSISVKELKEFSNKSLSFPRGSPRAVVLFSNE